MSYEDLFRRYGRPSEDGEIQIRAYLRRPEALKEASEILWMDKSAASAIQAMETYTKLLQEYRQALVARYGELETMPYKLRLEIHRRHLCDGHKVYDVQILRIYEDGSKVTELLEHYKGKERREALARFEALRKSRPGIEAVKDIEKQRWER